MSCAHYPQRAWPNMCCDGRYDEALMSMCEEPQTAPFGVCVNVTAPVYTKLKGNGDCCPIGDACKGGTGPYAVSTGDDYPAASMAACDRIPGCVAVGQMYSYVTRYHFSSKTACVESSKASPAPAFEYECDYAPVTSRGYESVAPMKAKAPWACYALSSK